MSTIDSSASPSIFFGMNVLYNTASGARLKDDEDHLAASLIHRQQLEFTYCRDFRCCGRKLEDLHDLLQHTEDHHSLAVAEEEPGNLYDEQLLGELTKQQTIVPESSHITSQDLRALESGECVEANESTYDTPPTSPERSTGKPTLPVDNVTIAKTIRRLSSTFLSTHEWMEQVSALFKLQEGRSDKPYKCRVDGCGKAYKNANGLKYHKIHGHCDHKIESDAARSLKKPYTCTIGVCRKRYKNLNGLKYHVEHTHVAQLCQNLPITPPVSDSLLSTQTPCFQ